MLELLIAAILMLGAAGLILILLVRYFSVKRQYVLPDSPGSNTPDLPESDLDGFVERFARMIQIPTVSWTDRSKRDSGLFSQL